MSEVVGQILLQIILILLNAFFAATEIAVISLNEKKKDLQSEGRTTDAVDDLIIKVGYAPVKKFKVIERDRRRDEAR